MKGKTGSVLMILGVLLAPALTVYAQDRTAVVTDTAPIYVRRTPTALPFGRPRRIPCFACAGKKADGSRWNFTIHSSGFALGTWKQDSCAFVILPSSR